MPYNWDSEEIVEAEAALEYEPSVNTVIDISFQVSILRRPPSLGY